MHRAHIDSFENHPRHTWQNSELSSGKMKLAVFDVGVRHPFSHNGVHTDKTRTQISGKSQLPSPSVGTRAINFNLEPQTPQAKKQQAQNNRTLLRALRFTARNFNRGRGVLVLPFIFLPLKPLPITTECHQEPAQGGTEPSSFSHSIYSM